MKVPRECSWVWRNVLYMRKTAKQFIKYAIADGTSTSRWFDPWCKGQILWDSNEAKAHLSMLQDATVCLLLKEEFGDKQFTIFLSAAQDRYS
ncbi:hypothetical protein FRX31_034210 [Thalictrum thalictroides]|uniref:Uncharacterized protein n=1 Tax=Thalictrum thalictroides TaxID=46969 RepID=A0A7J6UVF7_THATH|nr:hypothetical protein FRX31_034210 [Thalictrum thalictroides]